MITRGIYAAGLSVINDDFSLNIDATIKHGEFLIKKGLHGVFFFGSTGQSQLIPVSEKKELISKLSLSKFKKNFYLGTGNNSLLENIDLIKYSMEYKFNNFLIMPPAYYQDNTDEGVLNFYSTIITQIPKVKIILYNFEKLSGYKFSKEMILKLVKKFPKNIIGCKDSSHNLFENLKIKDFLIFPGTEAKLLKGLKLGCAGCISAVTNVTHSLARKVFDDFENKKNQTMNEKLISVRETFDNYNLISAVHSFKSIEEKHFANLLPPLITLNQKELKELLLKLEGFEFIPLKNRAA